jgi:hypothetical protein
MLIRAGKGYPCTVSAAVCRLRQERLVAGDAYVLLATVPMAWPTGLSLQHEAVATIHWLTYLATQTDTLQSPGRAGQGTDRADASGWHRVWERLIVNATNMICGRGKYIRN